MHQYDDSEETVGGVVGDGAGCAGASGAGCMCGRAEEEMGIHLDGSRQGHRGRRVGRSFLVGRVLLHLQLWCAAVNKR